MNDERRKFFRVQDSVLIKYRVVQGDMIEFEQHEVEMNRVRVDNARAALFGIETDFQEICERLRRDEPTLVEALGLLNRKINLIERVVSTEVLLPSETDLVAHELKSVSLSAGGLGVTSTTPLTAGANLVIDLILLPAHEPMRVFGKVVSCNDAGENDFDIRVEFQNIRNDDREKLIQHVLHRQSEQLKAQRQRALG